MRKSTIILSIFLIIPAFMMLTVSCGKLTDKNYRQLKLGMEYDEVVQLFGKAEECSSAIGIKKCIWGDEKKFVQVNFAGDKVVVFSQKGLKWPSLNIFPTGKGHRLRRIDFWQHRINRRDRRG